VTGPEISVVVPARDRPIRLRWLLNALEEQSLGRGRFEAVVVHDSAGPATERLLREHPLARTDAVRQVALPPRSAEPAAKRDIGWRRARAPLVAFTYDSCRPPPEWLERALRAARRSPGAVVQGRTEPDPDERNLLHAPWRHTRRIDPPTLHGDACNIVYPRKLLERLGGFDGRLAAGDDTDLAARGRRAGAPFLAASEVLTYHAVLPSSLYRRLRRAWPSRALPEVVRRNPELRRDMALWVFWKRTHGWLGPALGGALLARRNPVLGLLAIPWLVHSLPRYGSDPRGRYRALSELPARLAIDLTELAVLAYGSARSRTVVL
jgi:hypothetical protein